MTLTFEDQSAALLAAIKEYEASKWKVIGQKVGKPAKVGRRSRSPPPFTCMLTISRRASSMQRRISGGRSERGLDFHDGSFHEIPGHAWTKFAAGEMIWEAIA